MFVKVENVNDNAPLTEHPVYYPSVAESSPAGVKVLQLIAEDGDNDPQQKITYRITSGNPEGFFAINSSSGKLTNTHKTFRSIHFVAKVCLQVNASGLLYHLSHHLRMELVCVDRNIDQKPLCF